MRLVDLAFPLVALAGLATLTSCSDPVPPTPQAAYTVNFSQIGSCPIGSHQVKVGDVDLTNRRSFVVDGVSSSDVGCSVTGSSSFVVEAQAVQGVDSLTFNVPAITTAAKKGSPVKGTLAFSSEKTAGQAYASPSDSLCDFWFEDGSSEGIGPGKVWLSFSCTKVVESNNSCAITSGVAIFENCSM